MDPTLYETKNDDTLQVMKLHTQKIMKSYQLPFEFINDPDQAQIHIPQPKVERVAIVGAGVAGLLLAMRLGENTLVDVYEASDRDRVGGRLYTYKFPKGGEWDYFDVGAMRFPNTSVMKPTYDLFKELKIPLLNYQISCGQTWLHYNDIQVQRSAAAGKDFGARVSRGGNVPDKWVDIGVDKLMKNVYGRFVAKLRKNFNEGYKELMKYDEHSTRSFMAFVELESWKDPGTGEQYSAKERYPTSIINWLETMESSAGSFDMSLSETILHYYAFAAGLPDTQWRCVKHGSQRITDKLFEILTTILELGGPFVIKPGSGERGGDMLGSGPTGSTPEPQSLTGPSPVPGTNDPLPHSPEWYRQLKDKSLLAVTWESPNGTNHSTPFTYSQVVMTVSPQCMRYIDLSMCMLDYGQRSSLLMLNPGPSIKVGMKFDRNFWAGQKITGGQSATDRPVRTVVYPSYGGGQSKVLIASYSWTQDATSMGAWMRGPGSFDEKRLKDVILADLAAIHDIKLADLQKWCEDMYAFNWSSDSQFMSAFASFNPGQFSFLLQNLTRPAAGGRLHFAGDAISTCHGWVAGAIDSANRVFNQINPWRYQPPTHIPPGRPPPEVPLETMFGSDVELLQLGVSTYLQKKEFGF